jgi:large subunit ribosomal protein L25
MERVELKAASRTVQGKQVKQLRAESWIPAVLYGPDTPSKHLQIQQRLLQKALRQAGSTALIDLFVDGEDKPYVVLARDIQHQALTGRLQHVDFYQVRLTEKVKTAPRLEFVGECPLVDTGKAVLIHAMNTVNVECLPTDLISVIEVDVSRLQDMEDSIVVADLVVPSGVTILDAPDEVVVSLVPTRTAMKLEEEEAVAAEEGPEKAD